MKVQREDYRRKRKKTVYMAITPRQLKYYQTPPEMSGLSIRGLCSLHENKRGACTITLNERRA
jgi:CO dehydrogenase/acetyl-CoA synthase alpha subunit